MKKLITYAKIIIIVSSLAFISCEKEIEWYASSQTL